VENLKLAHGYGGMWVPIRNEKKEESKNKFFLIKSYMQTFK
jgi:hypothetical protein